jgi:hypothetical protein
MYVLPVSTGDQTPLVHLHGIHDAVGYALGVGHVVTDEIVDMFSVTIAVNKAFPAVIE